MAGNWTPNDDATWAAFLIIGFFWLIPLAIETFFRFQKNFKWSVIAFGIFLNCLKIFLLSVYLYFGWSLGRWGEAKAYYSVYGVVQILLYISSDVVMYLRKKLIAPEDHFYLDEIVLGLCNLLNLGAGVPNVVLPTPPENLWEYTSNILTAAIFLNVIYFDIFYIYRFMQIFIKNQKKVKWNNVLPMLLPVTWTLVSGVSYLMGSVVYSMGKANFYTNAIWNFASVVYPIVSFQSNISVASAHFLLTTKSQKSSMNQ
jgi:hypothetical protein